MLPAGKTKKEIALQLAEQGMKIPEIAKKIDAKYSTVYNWLNPEKCKTKKKDEKTALDYKNPDARPGWNADRKKCKTCKFRPATALKSNGAGCDYLDLIGHSRGCAVEDCDRYVKGVRMEKKMTKQEKEPSEVLSEFLNYIDRVRYDYKTAQDAVKTEDKRLQDLLHELEFAEDKAARNRVATKFQRSRRERRRQKDEMMRLDLIVQFFDDPTPKSTINKMRQLLGKQRKQEEFLGGERHYNKRVRD